MSEVTGGAADQSLTHISMDDIIWDGSLKSFHERVRKYTTFEVLLNQLKVTAQWNNMSHTILVRRCRDGDSGINHRPRYELIQGSTLVAAYKELCDELAPSSPCVVGLKTIRAIVVPTDEDSEKDVQRLRQRLRAETWVTTAEFGFKDDMEFLDERHAEAVNNTNAANDALYKANKRVFCRPPAVLTKLPTNGLLDAILEWELPYGVPGLPDEVRNEQRGIRRKYWKQRLPFQVVKATTRMLMSYLEDQLVGITTSDAPPAQLNTLCTTLFFLPYLAGTEHC